MSSLTSVWLRDLTQKIETEVLSFEWCWRRMEKMQWPEKVTNEDVLQRLVEMRTFIHNIPIGLVILIILY